MFEGQDSKSGFDTEPRSAQLSEYRRLKQLIIKTEEKLAFTQEGTPEEVNAKNQLDILNTKFGRICEKLTPKEVAILEQEVEGIEELRITDFSKIAFTTESGNTYTIEKNDDGLYSILNGRTNAVESIVAHHIENVMLRRGEKLVLGSGETTKVTSIEILA